MPDKYTRSAKGQPCQIRIPGFCRPGPENETVVAAHLNGAGMGLKASNIHIAYACSACHDVVDGRTQTDFPRVLLDYYHLQGVIRTQTLMIENKILIL